MGQPLYNIVKLHAERICNRFHNADRTIFVGIFDFRNVASGYFNAVCQSLQCHATVFTPHTQWGFTFQYAISIFGRHQLFFSGCEQLFDSVEMYNIHSVCIVGCGLVFIFWNGNVVHTIDRNVEVVSHDFTFLAVYIPTGPDFQNLKDISLVIKQDSPAANTQFVPISLLKFGDIFGQGRWILCIKLDLLADQLGLIRRHFAQIAKRLFAVRDVKHVSMLANRVHRLKADEAKP
uniref:Uncharacterized protein n=1 Tax=Magnetococcus massalia (strain MO-1) TaxID=451514 RepID=A0A1S7LJ31_MAGMO|nr:protein of unknown function [Candidatus Magnetococcus massalia]